MHTKENLDNVCMAKWLHPFVHSVFIHTRFFFMSVMHKCPCQLLLFAKGSFENVKEEEEEDADSWRCLLG